MPVRFLAGTARHRTSGSELEFELVTDRDPAEAEERDSGLSLRDSATAPRWVAASENPRFSYKRRAGRLSFVVMSQRRPQPARRASSARSRARA